MISDFINPTAFFIAFIVGIIYTYIVSPEPIYLIKYPTPLNIDDITYTDAVGTCYKYGIKETSCKENGKIYKKMTLND